MRYYRKGELFRFQTYYRRNIPYDTIIRITEEDMNISKEFLNH